jgi:hypothetical protein
LASLIYGYKVFDFKLPQSGLVQPFLWKVYCYAKYAVVGRRRGLFYQVKFPHNALISFT